MIVLNTNMEDKTSFFFWTKKRKYIERERERESERVQYICGGQGVLGQKLGKRKKGSWVK